MFFYNNTYTTRVRGVIEFNIPGTSLDYINLAKTQLNISYKLTYADGTPVQDIRDLNGEPTVDSDQIALVNLSLHSILHQIDLYLNKK